MTDNPSTTIIITLDKPMKIDHGVFAKTVTFTDPKNFSVSNGMAIGIGKEGQSFIIPLTNVLGIFEQEDKDN